MHFAVLGGGGRATRATLHQRACALSCLVPLRRLEHLLCLGLSPCHALTHPYLPWPSVLLGPVLVLVLLLVVLPLLVLCRVVRSPWPFPPVSIPACPLYSPGAPGSCRMPTHSPFPPSFSSSLSVCFVVCAVLFLASRQSLHLLLTRWCSQMLPPPQSLHLLLCRWCSQMLLPPQSLHVLLTRWCSQMPLPPQSLHVLLCRWCSQRFRPLRCLMTAKGLSACPAAWPDAFDASPRTFLRRFPLGAPPSARSSSGILRFLLGAAAAAVPSVRPDIGSSGCRLFAAARAPRGGGMKMSSHHTALDGVSLSAAWRPTPKAKATVYTEGDER